MYLVTQSCPSLCNSMDCSPPGSSFHGNSQATTPKGLTAQRREAKEKLRTPEQIRSDPGAPCLTLLTRHMRQQSPQTWAEARFPHNALHGLPPS